MSLFQSIAQIIPNRQGVETPSKIDAPVVVDAGDMRSVGETKVSFEPDGISNPKSVQAYMAPGKLGRFIRK